MSLTRLSKIKGQKDLIGGRDLAGIFEEGVIYSVKRIGDNILLEKIGKGSYELNHKGQSFTEVIMKGDYLLTENEIIK